MKNILFVGAHFDDIELGCGGTVAKFAKAGKKVIGCVLTDSAYGDLSGRRYRSEKAALAEGKAAARILGLRIEYCGYKTKTLEFEEGLVEHINRIITNHSIDTVFTHWVYDITHDHFAAARATLTAARHVPNVLMYRSNWYNGPETFNSNFFVDITDYANLKVNAIKKHKTEYLRRGDGWIEFFLDQNRSAGKMVNVQYAESFQLVSMRI